MTAMPPRTRRGRGDKRPMRPGAGRAGSAAGPKGAARLKTPAEPTSAAELKSIVWLASYPKSGNTWTRMFLANYLLNAREPLPINQVHRIGFGDSISGAYWLAGGRRYDPADRLRHLRLRDRVLRGFAGTGADMNFVKTHNTRQRVLETELIPAKYTRSAIYILRHPLDVAISYARHYGITPSEAVLRFSRPDNGIAGDSKVVRQYLGDWSGHVRSWTEAHDIPVHAMRYEDMKRAPHDSFSEMLAFLGVPLDAERLDRAVRFSSFEEMRRQEGESSFVERSQHSERFFHSGETGQWKGCLSPEEIKKARRDHGEVMARFGYL